jgi:hypothetical protein
MKAFKTEFPLVNQMIEFAAKCVHNPTISSEEQRMLADVTVKLAELLTREAQSKEKLNG